MSFEVNIKLITVIKNSAILWIFTSTIITKYINLKLSSKYIIFLSHNFFLST